MNDGGFDVYASSIACAESKFRYHLLPLCSPREAQSKDADFSGQ